MEEYILNFSWLIKYAELVAKYARGVWKVSQTISFHRGTLGPHEYIITQSKSEVARLTLVITLDCLRFKISDTDHVMKDSDIAGQWYLISWISEGTKPAGAWLLTWRIMNYFQLLQLFTQNNNWHKNILSHSPPLFILRQTQLNWNTDSTNVPLGLNLIRSYLKRFNLILGSC